jgi:hypothetical protein
LPHPGKKPYLSAEINCRTQEKPDPGKTDLGAAKAAPRKAVPEKLPHLGPEINCRTQEKPYPGKTDLGTANCRTQESRT